MSAPEGFRRSTTDDNSMIWVHDKIDVLVTESEGSNYKYTINAMEDRGGTTWGFADNKRVARAIAVYQMKRYAKGEGKEFAPKSEVDKSSAIKNANPSSYEIRGE